MTNNNSAKREEGRYPGPATRSTNGSSSYDGFFLVFFYACALQSYDVFFFYHKA
jgi:hypothetical protein